MPEPPRLKRVEFGTHIDISAPAASARELEAEGFDYVNCGEHMVFHGPTESSFVALSAAAAVTTSIKLLSAIIVLPLYPTILVAKLATTLDIVSKGRYNLGIGVGGEYAKEFEVSGVPVRERASRADEALDVIRHFWRDDVISYKGQYHDFEDVKFEPKPVRPSGVPIWVAGRKRSAMVRAGRFADVWFPYLYTPDMLAESLSTVKDAAEEAGRQRSEVDGAVLLYISVYDDAAKARRVAIEQMGGMYNQDFDSFVDRYIVHGDPSAVRSRLRDFIDAGASKIMTFLAAPAEDRDAMRRLLITEVLPEFRMAPPNAGVTTATPPR